ncbi:uncharacterized protein BDZ99DRAFT_282716 [Mytilinidion resinicola]|uniref:Uncharacterized protein n=1 Tax=Mytilinidion resinicola TaxID=574789 RepID=A0A6A6YVB2_9PEZI|nr:uncharacterized protein BDZ99DRAFT_282716 [Mytilinidion resinicola]KAF2811897.1 hypothetical protein BDZ99DRAFT_282716 [Mytilinidion resinicola]
MGILAILAIRSAFVITFSVRITFLHLPNLFSCPLVLYAGVLPHTIRNYLSRADLLIPPKPAAPHTSQSPATATSLPNPLATVDQPSALALHPLHPQSNPLPAQAPTTQSPSATALSFHREES